MRQNSDHPIRVLVIGGKGFFGRRVVDAFATLDNCEVWLGGRSASAERELRIDLKDETTFPAMEGFDFVINCANSLKATSEPAIRYALHNHIFFIDTTADAAHVERVLFSVKQEAHPDAPQFKGVVLLGMGIFPGLSNMVAAALHRSEGVEEHLELGIHLNALSGAGRGMRSLMVNLVEQKAVHYHEGRRVELPPMSPGPAVPFHGNNRVTLRAWFPETSMLHLSIRVPNISTSISVSPPILQPMLKLLAHILPRRGALKWTILSCLGLALTVLRGVVLRWKATPVVITATDPARPGRSLSLYVDNGVVTGAYAVAAAVALLSEDERPNPGVYTPDELMGLDSIGARFRSLTHMPFEFRLQGVSAE